jgi:hypothetical protein
MARRHVYDDIMACMNGSDKCFVGIHDINVIFTLGYFFHVPGVGQDPGSSACI